MYNFKAIVNGQFVDGENELKIINPTNKTIAGTVSALNKQQIDAAFDAAKSAQKKWENLGLEKRIEILKSWVNLIEENKINIANIMVDEIAKNFNDSIKEIERTIEYINDTFAVALNLKPLEFGENELKVKNKIGIYNRVAKGVGLAISPFNYPVNLAMSKIIPFLVMGNTVVFKPATAGSLVGSYLGKLSVEANLPIGIFNVVTGKGSEIGDELVVNDKVDFISFTGSVNVGKRILQIASTKDIVLELGGKDPALVLDNSNIDYVANEIVDGAFSFSGQRCTAIKRVLITDSIADELVPILKQKIENLTVGNPKENNYITPMIDDKSADFIQKLIDDSLNKGAKLIIGNERKENLFYPTLIDNVTKEMDLAWEEPFGPVLPIIRTKDVDEMVKISNESNFGLQASIFSSDIEQASKIANCLEVGTVNINAKTSRGPDALPFLGVKDSGFGVQGITEALLSSSRYKGIVINKIK